MKSVFELFFGFFQVLNSKKKVWFFNLFLFEITNTQFLLFLFKKKSEFFKIYYLFNVAFFF